MALKTEIFDQNTTLFNVLDENDVTKIGILSSKIDHLNEEVGAVKLQLDGLARVVDQNQARNEAQFVNINTSIVQIHSSLDVIDARFQAIGNKLEEIDTDIEQLRSDTISELNAFQMRLDSMNFRINNVENEIEANSTRINQIQSEVENNKVLVNSLQGRVNALESSMENTETVLDDLKFKTRAGSVIPTGYKLAIWVPSKSEVYFVTYSTPGPLLVGTKYQNWFTGGITGERQWALNPKSPYHSFNRPANIAPYAITGQFYIFWRSDGTNTWEDSCYVF